MPPNYGGQVLDSGTLMDSTHRASLTNALLCVSRARTLYPKALRLYGIQMAGEASSAEGSYGEVFKGRFGSHLVALKVFKVKRKSDTAKVHKVCFPFRSI